MKTKKMFLSVLVVTIAAAIVGLVAASHRKADRVVTSEPGSQPVAAVSSVSSQSTPPATTPVAAIKPRVQSSMTEVPAVAEPPNVATPAGRPAKAKEPIQDPIARAALSLVGIDPRAEAYWLGAIFDSSLPKQEREDLMEDLNEDGLSDHKRPGPGDYPLIVNRLAIIEQIAPYSDEFMLEHLQEAYKDLLNLSQVALGGGKPVQ